MSKTDRIIIKIPEKPAEHYRKLSDGFDLFYRLTDVEVEQMSKKITKRP